MLLNKRKINKIYCLDTHSGKTINFLSKILLPVNRFKDFKEISYPEAVGKAGEESIKITEFIWNNLNNNRFVESSLLAFFKNIDIVYSFKRQLNNYVENTLINYFKILNLTSEQNKNVIFVPKDKTSLKIIEVYNEQSSIKLPNNFTIHSYGKILNSIYSTYKFFLNILYPFILIFIVIKNKGVCFKSPIKKIYKIAGSNTFGVKTQGIYPNDIFFTDNLNFNKKDTIIITHKKFNGKIRNIEEYLKEEVDTVDPDELKIPVNYLLKFSIRLIKTSTFSSLITSKTFIDYFKSALFYQIYVSLNWELLFEHYTFKIIWSNEDKQFEDELITVIANKYNIKHLLIPNFLISKTGCASAYHNYNYIFCSGHYFQDAYGKTWNKNNNIIFTGIPMNDQLNLKDSQLASENTQKLIKKLKKDNKIISIFTGSYQGEKHSEDRYFKMVKMCKNIIEMHKNVCIILKPKIKKSYFKAINMFTENPEFIKLINSIPKNKFFIIDPKEGYECSATYLMKNSNITISMAGDAYPLSSVWAEALMMNKPSFAYNPPFVDLPLLKEFKDTLIFSEEKGIINAVNNALKDQWKMPHEERLKYLFDPYCDGKAIERIIKKMNEICDKNAL